MMVRARAGGGEFELPPTTITEAAVRRFVDLATYEFSYASVAIGRDLIDLARRYEAGEDDRLAGIVRAGLQVFTPGYPPGPLEVIRLANLARGLFGGDHEAGRAGWLPATWQHKLDMDAAETGPGTYAPPPPPYREW